LKTDSIFYRIFQSSPDILFELLGRSPDLAQGRKFGSVEIKQVAFRLDGVLFPSPDAPDRTIWFIEVQMQSDPVFYQRFFAEIYFYLNLYPQTADWQALVIYPTRSVEPKNRGLYRANLNSEQVHRVYLEDFSETSTESLGIGMMQLIMADAVDAIPKAKVLLAKTQPFSKTDAKFAAIMELIETIVVYKFPSLGREEIENMLGLSELKQTKVYQEALHEGEQIGEQRGEQRGEQTGALREAQSLILRQLTCRIGKIPSTLRSQVQSLSLPQLESLGEALLDFTSADDLKGWLRTFGTQLSQS
jgi:predicted transposase/invertase (TIGR01784 family)